MAIRSVRRRLILLLLGVLTPIWLLLAIGANAFVLHEVDKQFDHQLEQVAATLFTLDLAQLKAAVDAPGFHAFDDQDSFAAYVWSADGTLRFRSEFAPKIPFIAAPPRFTTVNTEEGRWRVIWVRDIDSSDWLVVARPMTELQELAIDFVASLVLPFIVSLLIMISLVWIAIGRGLAPLHTLSQQIAGRRPDDLSPIAAAETPREALALVDEINLLLARVGTALDNERRFTADASHELRTPLAAIRAQVEVAAAEADPVARQHALAQATKAVGNATRLTEQLLTLARLDHLDVIPDAGDCDLRALAREELIDCTSTALAKGVELELIGDEQGWVRGSPSLIRLAIRNLLENAVAHTPSGGLVTVTLAGGAEVAELSVGDGGSGAPAEVLARLGERFFRAAHKRPGSGLGLSIVRRVAALHGATLRFDSPAGLLVTLQFPALPTTHS